MKNKKKLERCIRKMTNYNGSITEVIHKSIIDRGLITFGDRWGKLITI